MHAAVIKVGADTFEQNLERDIGRATQVIWPVARQRIEYIGDMDDLADLRNLVTGQMSRVAAAILALVMLQQRGQLLAQQPAQFLLAHDLMAFGWMLLNLGELLLAQAAILL